MNCLKPVVGALMGGMVVLASAQTPAPAALPAALLDVPADAADGAERLQVVAPYVELHTGPGRGYPVFHLIHRGDWLVLELRHTDWFRVHGRDGRVGWVHRTALESTLTEAGVRKTFRDVLLDDFLRRKVELGISWGRLRTEPVIRFWGGYRLADTVVAELSLSQVQGVYSGTTLWQIGLQSDPWADHRLAPFFGIGMGRFRNIPNQSLVDSDITDVKQATATLGLRYHLSDRFMLRLDTTLHTAFLSDSRAGEYRTVSAGLGFFF